MLQTVTKRPVFLRKANVVIASKTFSSFSRAVSNFKSIIKRTTAGDASSSANQVFSRPPFAIRAAIVGASVGLATPLFALGGAARLWISYLPSSERGRMVKYAVGLALGVGSTGLFYNYVIPFLRYNSDFMLPFACSNALMATFWYGVGEFWLGLDVMLTGFSESVLVARNFSPAIANMIVRLVGASGMAGGAVGALTALTAPYCWPFFFSICWDKDLKTLLMKDDPYWIIDLYNWIAIPIGVPVGILAGMTLQTLLKSYVVGVPSTPWANRSLPLLVGIFGLSGIYYTCFRSFSTDFLWEARTDHETGKQVSYNPRTGVVLADNGSKAATSLMKREVMKRINNFRHLFRFYGEADAFKPKVLSPNEEITVSVLDQRALLFNILDVLVRIKHLQLEKVKQQKMKAIINKSSFSQEDRDFIRFDFDAKIKDIVREFDVANKGNQGVNILSLLDIVEKGIVSKRIEDRFENSEDYRGVDHMYADSVRRIQRMSDCTLDEKTRNSLAMLAVNLDMAFHEFRNKLGFEIREGSDEEKAIVREYRIKGINDVVTQTMKTFLIAGALGSGMTALAIFLFGNR